MDKRESESLLEFVERVTGNKLIEIEEEDADGILVKYSIIENDKISIEDVRTDMCLIGDDGEWLTIGYYVTQEEGQVCNHYKIIY